MLAWLLRLAFFIIIKYGLVAFIGYRFRSQPSRGSMLLAHGVSFALRATAGLYVRFRFITSSVVVSILNVLSNGRCIPSVR